MSVIAVLFGGQSSEHPVSLMSAASVLNNFDEKYTKYMVGITTDGRWYHYTGSVDNIENGKWQFDENNQEVILSASGVHHGFYNLKTNEIDRVDAIFPILHGKYGEDGSIQGLCYLSGIPCISTNMTSCAIAMDKEFTHIICEDAGIKMAKYLVYKKGNCPSYEEMFKEAEEKLQLPCYVKPAREGSSFGAHKIKNYDDFIKYVDDAFSYDDKILLEEFIDGTEVGCGILGTDTTGEVYEVVVETEMYGYAEKYDGYKTKIYVPAKNISKEVQQQVNKLGLKIANILECDVLARVDFFNSSKGLIFNEVNTIPGFTSHSLYPAMFKEAGIGYKELINKLIELKLKD